MWRLKQLIPKEQTGLEGKTVEVGSLKLQIRSTIAQGGFSSVYLARDPQSGKLYALKHIICNDSESLDLIKKEVNALKCLRGHPNVVTLHAQSMYDMGRTKECFIVTEYCEKMLVDYLDNRGAGYLDEKQLLIMFRDVCNAVYAMHSQSPPMAHRDLKAENLLLGSDGQWKLCDFGSISTNHKRFETPSEMGIEEDIIRKHTTPAYRAPEMWDLYRREIISEKVDIWALGCLLYRMAYLKSAFDGESKLQILNGNYRIPDLPKYSSNVTGLIRDMLNSSPDARPDALQVWQRVNGALPHDCQKNSPDRAPSAGPAPNSIESAGYTNQSKSSSVMPSRSPPPPPQRSSVDRPSSPAVKETDHSSASGGGKGGGMGSFWSTQYAQDAVYGDDSTSPATTRNNNSNSQPVNSSKSPLFDDDKSSPARGKISTPSSQPAYPSKIPSYDDDKSSPARNMTGYPAKSPLQGPQTVASPKSVRADVTRQRGSRLNEGGFNDNDINNRGSSNVGFTQTTSRDEAFNEFVADFQKMSNMGTESKVDGVSLQAELDNLRNELKQVQKEKLEITAKYDKLAAICRSQRLEIQELKSSLAASNNPSGASQPQKSDRQGGTIWDLQDGLKTSVEPQGWKAFDDGPSKKLLSGKKDFQEFSSARYESSRSESRWMNDSSSKQSGDVWGLHDSFTSIGSGFTATRTSGQGSQGDSGAGFDSKGSLRTMTQTKPTGWSNF